MADLIPLQRGESIINSDGTPTLRFISWLEQNTSQTNSSTTIIAEASGINLLNAQLLQLQAQIGSGQELTVDTTGFTVDTTKQTTDMTEA